MELSLLRARMARGRMRTPSCTGYPASRIIRPIFLLDIWAIILIDIRQVILMDIRPIILMDVSSSDIQLAGTFFAGYLDGCQVFDEHSNIIFSSSKIYIFGHFYFQKKLNIWQNTHQNYWPDIQPNNWPDIHQNYWPDIRHHKYPVQPYPVLVHPQLVTLLGVL